MNPGAGAARGRLVLIAAGLTAVRLLAAGLIPLTEDEAYYRLWAQHLQAGYLDHPPMIAWWIRLGELVAGDTALGARLLPTLATGLTTWLVGDLARRLGLAQATAERAALWYNATFTVALGGLLATPDTPACLFWTLSLWCLARRWERGDGRWWLGAGLAAGLSCLSKYSGLFLAPGVFMWLLATPRGLAELKRPWPWLAAALALLAFAPNVAWNATHGWLTFDKQFGRVGGHGLHLADAPEFLGAQFLLLNPLLAVFAARGTARAWRDRRTADAPRVLLPLAVAAPFLLYLTVHSLHDRVQGHWPVPAFGALALAAAFAAESGPVWMRRAVPALGLGLSALLLAHLATPWPRLGPSDPALHLRGWPAFARAVEAERRAQGAAWVGVLSYGVAAQLDFAGAVRAPVVQIQDRDRYFGWQASADLSGPGLVLDLERRLKAVELQRCFGVVQPLGIIDRAGGRSRWTRYALFRVSAPKRDVLRQGCAKSGDEP
ncbi:MAG TPA: glycosyltransferase family 39 protein [Phenylobacterium sp.]|uniref:ArnT family glycosyltransferase n=1 Tax=Phenylobacterium sp. TaxID=1871053 RepID=UPI002B4A558D|nr:glycosyltransferase family 39 protein [Phenylobacterium sp.]HKR87536.1 glycosyltransferase family 39 protein [Phenylobacterium sp.]